MTDPTAVLDPTPVPPAETFLERAARIFAGDIRPADYAPVPDEVREQIDRLAADFKSRHGCDYSPAGRQMVANDLLAQYYGNGVGIVSERTDRGLILLAVGGEQVGPFLDHYRDWPRPGVCYEVSPRGDPGRPGVVLVPAPPPDPAGPGHDRVTSRRDAPPANR